MKKTVKVWTPKDIKPKDVLFIMENYGFDNDTLLPEAYDRNQTAYEIKISIKRIKKEITK